MDLSKRSPNSKQNESEKGIDNHIIHLSATQKYRDTVMIHNKKDEKYTLISYFNATVISNEQHQLAFLSVHSYLQQKSYLKKQSELQYKQNSVLISMPMWQIS